MDLNKILAECSGIYNEILTGENIIDLETFAKKLNDLDEHIDTISDILEKIKHMRRKSKEAFKRRNIFGTVCKKSSKSKIAEVDSVDDLPIYNIFWVKNINQYGININGEVLYGNFCNSIKTKITANKKCRYREKCEYIKQRKVCPFYHDKLEVLKYDLPDDIKKQYLDKTLSVPYLWKNTASKNTLQEDLAVLEDDILMEKVIHILLVHLKKMEKI